MPGLADFSVPSYDQPPSPAQAEQLGMERNRLEMEQAQILQRGFEKMQKKVAMARVMGDAAELQAAGLDPEEARSQALLKSGRGLFDSVEEWNKVSTNLEDSIARKRATQAFHHEVQNLIADGKDPQDALASAYAIWGPEIAGRTGIQPFINAQTRASTAAKSLTEKRDEFLKNQERLKTLEADKTDLSNQRITLGYDKLAETSTHNQAMEEAAQGKPKAMNPADKAELSSIYKRIDNLQKAHDKLIPEEGAVEKHPNTIARMRLNTEITKLRQKAAELSGNKKDEPPPDANGSTGTLKLGTIKVDKNGVRAAYQGGDENDPASWKVLGK